ncbi:hypothetical protein KGM_204764 [Danaus plexippus plexippus]|uniref:Uncharacterized protein n=1 Tax=Danaus plexippus plexippus TaxID=278856 RepID=A0A212FEI6_DANPL|nr:hypothetical protein KGM_204764 [Danaus plexippus plexippus]
MNFHTEGCGSRSPPAVIQLGTKRLENNYRSDPVPAISSPTLTTLYSTRHTSITYSGSKGVMSSSGVHISLLLVSLSLALSNADGGNLETIMSSDRGEVGA